MTNVTLPKRIEKIWAGFPENLILDYLPAKPYLALAAAIQARQQILAIAATTSPVEGATTVPRTRTGPRSYVIVIGESLSTYHMQLYGYHRPTTPGLSALADKGEIVVFRDVVTSHPYTFNALGAALTVRVGSDRRTIIDVLNSAGFKTYWLSNQYKVGILDSGTGALASSANHQVWLNPPLSFTLNMTKQRYDEDLLPPLREALAEKQTDKVIFIHLVGNHQHYQLRYPKSAVQLPEWKNPCLLPDEAQIVSDYDASVYYNDFVVFEIINIVRRAQGEAFVLYFSDHGEEVYDFRKFYGREVAWLSPFMLRVPLLLWLSPEYIRRRGELVSLLPNAVDRPYSTSDLSYAIADLVGVTFPSLDSSRSLFHRQFSPGLRTSGGMNIDAFMREWKPDAAHASGIPLINCGLFSGKP
jgi:heptose-I-phosphate ethanolaminephosphotransferase